MAKYFHDILMITYNRPEFTRRSLTRLLETCDDNMRVWVWHNGEDQRTLNVVEELQSHPRFHHLHVSRQNKRLREPTNWFWENSDGRYLSKVDDDCLLPENWGETLRQVHEDVDKLGIIGCWRFYEDDFVPELAHRKIREYPRGHKIMRHHHVQGSGYVMKRVVYNEMGPIGEKDSFTHYCQRASAAGWDIGWHFPFLQEQHMDDARSPYCPYKTNEDFLANIPLSGKLMKVRSLEEWRARSRWLAWHLQADCSEGASWVGWRGLLRRARVHAARVVGRVEPWRST
jgi:glycosyltransferase involved in cell wall biosynthesis